MKKSLCLLGATLFALSSCSKDDKKPDPVKPVAAFKADATTIIAGGKVNFTDTSANTPTSWTWTFEGGAPGSSTAQNPVNIVYAAAGTYKVSLVATNAAGSSEPVEMQKYITVTPDPSAIFPKIVKYTDASYADNNYTATFTYDGNKIKEITYDNGQKRVFTYTGNTITKVEKYDKDNAVRLTTTLTYDNNKLKSYIETRTDNKYKIDFTYNSDGTISFVSTETNRGEETKSSPVMLTLDAKGNIVKGIYDGGNGILTVEYDTKNSPYKNISGYTLLLTVYNVLDQDVYSVNNITKFEKKKKDGVIISTTTYENTYDTNNFSTKTVKKIHDNVESYDSTKTYEYTY